jgi:hypothetical protein
VKKKFGTLAVNMIVRARSVKHEMGTMKILKPREIIGTANRARMVNMNKN